MANRGRFSSRCGTASKPLTTFVREKPRWHLPAGLFLCYRSTNPVAEFAVGKSTLGGFSSHCDALPGLEKGLYEF